mmetsp:Transcript_26221/g.61907  ORF Transcript_26221/g.61907 Transcript_26221/m.61907 type:complete len:444 (-) Transcript_26221:6636-7967(-)
MTAIAISSASSIPNPKASRVPTRRFLIASIAAPPSVGAAHCARLALHRQPVFAPLRRRLRAPAEGAARRASALLDQLLERRRQRVVRELLARNPAPCGCGIAAALCAQRVQHPVEMRQCMLDAWQGFEVGSGQRGAGQAFVVEHRQRPQPRPHARRRALLQQHLPRWTLDPEPPVLAPASLELAGLDRPARRLAVLAGAAHRLHRAAPAVGRARRADRRAKVHQTLGVAIHVPRGQQRRGVVPELPLRRAAGQVAVKGQRASEYPLHIAVEDGHALAEAEGRDGRGSRAADAGQGLQPGRGARETAAMQRGHGKRAGVQIARPAVVTQACPLGQHLIERRGSEVGNARPARQKALVVAQHGGHLGLLQHDLGQPDAIGVARVLPGQRVAAMAALPGHHGQTEVLVQRRLQRFWHDGQKNVERWPCTMRRISVLQRRQASPSRP